MTRHRKERQSGFSLIEMMLVLAILTLVMGVTMKAIMDVEKRQRTEEAKVDLNQEGREFVDQIVRDLHQAGYPANTMYAVAPSAQTGTFAQGITAGDQTSISFEGDVDGDGIVDIVNYQLSTDTAVAPAGQCPCKLQRSQVQKVDGGPQPAPSYSTEVDQVINSVGGAGAWTIAGNFTPNGSLAQSGVNNNYYAGYKVYPIFRYYNATGKELTPTSTTTYTDPSGNAATVADIKSVRISVSTMTRQIDPITGTFQAASMSAAARIANK